MENDMKLNWFKIFTDNLRDYSDEEVWSDGDEILCRTQDGANAIADLLYQLYQIHNSQSVEITIGYYDPKEDKGREDRYTGWYYITII
jgi:hypothetical protein